MLGVEGVGLGVLPATGVKRGGMWECRGWFEEDGGVVQDIQDWEVGSIDGGCGWVGGSSTSLGGTKQYGGNDGEDVLGI